MGPNPTSRFTEYHLHLSILQTCRYLHDQGTSILRQNNFALVSSKLGEVILETCPSNVPTWTIATPKKFKHHVMNVNISSRHTLGGLHTFHSLICAADLDSFVRVLREFTFIEEPEFILKFRMRGTMDGVLPLPLRVQRQLLLPFERLLGNIHSCDITGAVDVDLGNRVKSRLTSTVTWNRAQCRDFFEIIKFKQALADDMFNAGHFNLAHRMYSKIFEILVWSNKSLKQIMTTDDDTLRDTFELHLH